MAKVFTHRCDNCHGFYNCYTCTPCTSCDNVLCQACLALCDKNGICAMCAPHCDICGNIKVIKCDCGKQICVEPCRITFMDNIYRTYNRNPTRQLLYNKPHWHTDNSCSYHAWTEGCIFCMGSDRNTVKLQSNTTIKHCTAKKCRNPPLYQFNTDFAVCFDHLCFKPHSISKRIQNIADIQNIQDRRHKTQTLINALPPSWG